MKEVNKYDKKNKYIGKEFLQINPIDTAKHGFEIYFSKNDTTDIELPENFDANIQEAYFRDDFWELIDREVDGEFYLKENGSKFDKIKAKDINLYTEIKPSIEILDGDLIRFTDQWEYVKKSQLTIDKENKLKLEILKSQKIAELEGLYAKAQLCYIIDGIYFYISLKGTDYDLIKDRVSNSLSLGFTDLILQPVQVDKKMSLQVPYKDINAFAYIFINEIYSRINVVSIYNKKIKEYYLEKINNMNLNDNLVFNMKMYNDVFSLSNIENKIKLKLSENIEDLNKSFILGMNLDTTKLLDLINANIDNYSEYSAYQKNNFKLFYDKLTKNNENHYNLFEKITN